MYAIVDLETTGGNPARDRIIEVAIYVHNGKRVIETFTSLVNPGITISPFISAFTGITNQMVEQAPYFEEIGDKIAEITQKRIFVAHNVRFDYSFLRNEFKRNGEGFYRKQLCTVRLSRAVFPGMRSYGLKPLCAAFNIPLENRHRAGGDAAATAQLFDLVLQNQRESLVRQSIQDEMKGVHLPSKVDNKKIDLLPDGTGVYYFLNDKDQVLYVGKSKNIRKRVLNHFSSDLKSARGRDLKEQTSDIKAELTGSELIASLIESRDIKRFMPSFNTAQKRIKYRYGIYSSHNKDGYLTLENKLLNLEEEPLKVFSNKKTAEDFLKRTFIKQGLCFKFCRIKDDPFGCYEVELGECVGECPAKHQGKYAYNQRVETIINQFHYPYPNFFIIGRGRNPDEKSVVQIQKRNYIGFGFVPKNKTVSQDTIKEYLNQCNETPDIKVIINRYMKKNKKDEIRRI